MTIGILGYFTIQKVLSPQSRFMGIDDAFIFTLGTARPG